ncbi:MAG: Tat pathway signal protein [Anaerotruncus sp.]|nr:Tat pathway signal protein [Anaerotruncus sp.]
MELVVNGFLSIGNPLCLTVILVGVIIGIVFGAMPGLSTTMAVALFLPVTYGLESTAAMALLMGLYIGAISGGLVSAILLKIPGTPSSVATCWDGHPMAANGQAIKALGAGVVFSFLGSVISIVALMFISPPLARLATTFGFYEYFSIALFSLTMIASLSSGAVKKGVFSGVLGFMFATVGIAPIDATQRFTFGQPALMGGFQQLPVLIGLFAVSEMLAAVRVAKFDQEAQVTTPDLTGVKGFGFSMREFFTQLPNMLRSALIGIGIGILPGIGGGTSNILSYTIAKNQSKHPEAFGTGILDGIVASETANNASVGGAMIPLLTLGIPGDTVTAMLLGGLMMHGLTPGPLLFTKSAELVYSIFASLMVASILMLVVEFYGLRIFARLLNIPKYILLPLVFMLCVIGAYGNSSRIFDVYAILIFGVIGYLFSVFKIPAAPFILGFILGPMAETNLRRGLQLSRGSYLPFLTHPISCLFLIIAFLCLALNIYKELKPYLKARQRRVS